MSEKEDIKYIKKQMQLREKRRDQIKENIITLLLILLICFFMMLPIALYSFTFEIFMGLFFAIGFSTYCVFAYLIIWWLFHCWFVKDTKIIFKIKKIKTRK